MKAIIGVLIAFYCSTKHPCRFSPFAGFYRPQQQQQQQQHAVGALASRFSKTTTLFIFLLIQHRRFFQFFVAAAVVASSTSRVTRCFSVKKSPPTNPNPYPVKYVEH
jgi:hypothetical protein